MGRIPMPPPGGLIKPPKRCCLPHDEPLFIDFKHNGIFWPSTVGKPPKDVNGFFEPELPTEIVISGGAIGPFMPVRNNVDVMLNLFSFHDKEIYRYKIQIRTSCPGKKCGQ